MNPWLEVLMIVLAVGLYLIGWALGNESGYREGHASRFRGQMMPYKSWQSYTKTPEADLTIEDLHLGDLP